MSLYHLNRGDHVAFEHDGHTCYGVVEETIDSDDEYYIEYDENYDGCTCRYVHVDEILGLSSDFLKKTEASGLTKFLAKHDA